MAELVDDMRKLEFMLSENTLDHALTIVVKNFRHFSLGTSRKAVRSNPMFVWEFF